MPTYLYCLLTESTDAFVQVPRGLTGVGGEEIRRLELPGLFAWVGTVAAGAGFRTVEAARAHDRVVRAALDLGVTPLPARAGQVFPNDAACMVDLGGRERELRGALERVQGCVEMTVHVALAARPRPAEGVEPTTGVPAAEAQGAEVDTPASAGHRGREYLARVRERLRLERNLQVEAASARTVVHSEIQGLARGESSTLHPGQQPRLTIAHLIARQDVSRYRAALDALRGSHVSTIVHIGGPYPPYSFTGLVDG